MAPILLLLAASLLSSCDGGANDDAKRAEDPSDTPDAGGAMVRVKPRLVSIELPVVAHRNVSQGTDGNRIWGEAEWIDGAETCVIERRDAYATFTPYEALAEPICVTTQAGETATLSGIPANSDLTIRISKDGYLPGAMTHRVESGDIPQRAEVSNELTLLFEEQQADLFLPLEELPAVDESDRGFLLLETAMIPVGVPVDGNPPRISPQFVAAEGGELVLSSARGGEAAELGMPGHERLLGLGAGLYRAQASHPRAPCEPLGTPFSYQLWGLGTDAPGELELRVLPGHVTSTVPACLCARSSPMQQLVDGASCTVQEPSDAGAPE